MATSSTALWRKRWLGLLFLLLTACAEPTATPTPLPPVTSVPPVVALGAVTDSVAWLEGLTPPAGFAPTFVPANDDALLADIDAGGLAGGFLHALPTNNDRYFTPVALDGLLIIVHPDNPVRSLSRGQIQAIFAERSNNWAEVGGLNAPITLYTRERGAGSRTTLVNRIMAEARIGINASVHATDAALQAAVANDINGIGYVWLSSGSSLPAVAVDGIAANPATLADQSYPLTAPLYFVALEEPAGPPRGYIAWLQSADGQAAIGQRLGRVR